MQTAIFIFYLIFFSFLISIIPFFKNSAIGQKLLIILFLIKVFAGVAYAKFYTLPKYFAGSDTWRFYRWSIDETKWLLQDPFAFARDLFTYGYNKSGNLFSGENSYWNDLKSNVIIKIMAVINIFTKNSYYADIIFFNFLFLFGLVALYKVFYKIYPNKKFFIIAGVFLLPSTLFWCSGIHKDGLILSATGIIIYAFYKSIEIKFSIKRVSIILFCILVLFSLRNYVLFALLPALLSWSLCKKKYASGNINRFIIVYVAGATFLFIIPLIFPSLNLLSYITNKQNEFLLLEGGSKVKVQPLQPTLVSFVLFSPEAVDMAFLRPHLNEIKNFSFIPAVVEVLLLSFLLIISMAYTLTKKKLEPVVLLLLFFSMSVMLLSGYTIPFTGAIVRYRSVVLPLLITPLLCINNFSTLKRKISPSKSKTFN